MIEFHIGMPKAGSPSLQAYLNRHSDELAVHGVHYMRTGRMEEVERRVPLPSHNGLARHLWRKWDKLDMTIFDRFLAEFAAHKDQHCVVSGEMFWGQDLTLLNDQLFSKTDEPVNIIIYLRRFSDFIESNYKQREKKGAKRLMCTTT